MIKRLFMMLTLLLASMTAGTCVASDDTGIYRLRQGDKIMISVWREDTLQREVIVLPDGGITFPLIGRVEVVGMSTTEVEQLVADKLKKYLAKPIVSVVIVGIEGSRAYVTGRVVRPGPLVINGPITVLQAISTMGGLDKFASEGGIKVIRVTAEGQEVLPVNYKDIMSGRDVSTNILLKAGDTLVVP